LFVCFVVNDNRDIRFARDCVALILSVVTVLTVSQVLLEMHASSRGGIEDFDASGRVKVGVHQKIYLDKNFDNENIHHHYFGRHSSLIARSTRCRDDKRMADR
jgi:hypothetical protein